MTAKELCAQMMFETNEAGNDFEDRLRAAVIHWEKPEEVFQTVREGFRVYFEKWSMIADMRVENPEFNAAFLEMLPAPTPAEADTATIPIPVSERFQN